MAKVKHPLAVVDTTTTTKMDTFEMSKEHIDRCRNRRHNTVSGVTLEARRVLEHVIMRGLYDNHHKSKSFSGSYSYSRRRNTYSKYKDKLGKKSKLDVPEKLPPGGSSSESNARSGQSQSIDVDEEIFNDIDENEIKKYTRNSLHERRMTDKDMMYERIADQLCAIADNYELDLPPVVNTKRGSLELDKQRRHSSFSSISEHEEDTESVHDVTDVEKELAAVLRNRGDRASISMPEIGPLINNVIQSVTYEDFTSALGASLGSSKGWQKVAIMFRVTQTAVQLTGMGSSMASRIKENSIKYFEDSMAPWIIRQGGWETLIQNPGSEID